MGDIERREAVLEELHNRTSLVEQSVYAALNFKGGYPDREMCKALLLWAEDIVEQMRAALGRSIDKKKIDELMRSIEDALIETLADFRKLAHDLRDQ